MKKTGIIFIILVFMFALIAGATTLSPTPPPKAQFFDLTGKPLAGGLIWSYVPGTTTPKTTYSDSTGLVPNSNPVILDSAGRGNLFLNGYYDFIIMTSAGAELYSASNIGYASSSGASAFSQWYDTGLTPTRTGNTTFTVDGDQTAVFLTGIRMKSVNTAGTIYSTAVSSSFGGVSTTITVINDSGNLDSGLSSVSTSILTPSNTALPIIPVVTKTGGYTITAADVGKMIISNLTSTATFTIPLASAVPSGSSIITRATGSTLTISGTINDTLSSLTLTNGTEVKLWSKGTGTSWYANASLMDQAGNLRSASTVTAPYVIPVADAYGHIYDFAPTNMEVITSSQTFTAPKTGTYVFAVIGAGGGGGSGGPVYSGPISGGGGGGGGGGHTAHGKASLTVNTGYAVVVGAGGAGGAGVGANTPSNVGIQGGVSSFQGVSVTGGNPGHGGAYNNAGGDGAGGASVIPSSTGGAGGNAGANVTQVANGGTGGAGGNYSSTNGGGGGAGGMSLWTISSQTTGGAGNNPGGSSGTTATGSGSGGGGGGGGGGAGGSGGAGGTGRDGAVIIWWQ